LRKTGDNKKQWSEKQQNEKKYHSREVETKQKLGELELL
jgi:hypothetical protein